LRKRSAVRVGDDDHQARLLLPDGETLTVPLAELPSPAGLEIASDALPEARSSRGSLIRLAVASEAKLIKHGWDTGQLVEAALADLEQASEARALALDLVALERESLLDRLPLPASEINWIRAHHATTTADIGAAVDAISRLPIQGYRPKLGLLLTLWPAVRAAGLDLRVVEPHLREYAGEEPIAALLLRSLGERDDAFSDLDVVLPSQRSLIERLHATGNVLSRLETAVNALTGAAVNNGDLERLPARLRALIATQQAKPGLLKPPEVAELAPSILDDLIDAGSVDSELADLLDISEPTLGRYLRARLAPDTLTDADVAELGLNDELARRAFRYGASETLESLGDSARIRHYRALVELRKGRLRDGLLGDVDEGARPAAADLVALVEAKKAGVLDESLLTERLLGDPTVWPALVATAGAAELGALSTVRDGYPAFSEWLALHEAREHLYLGNWRDAANAATKCLDLAKIEAVRDEAQNLKACALYYVGDHLTSMQQLTEALEGAYSESLLANASLVAQGLAPEVAARHLGVLIREAPTLAMRVAAAHRAVEIWRSTDTSLWSNSDESPLPDAFQDALRELVVEQISLDDFRRFASVLAIDDRAWFGNPSNIATSPHSDSLEARFYQARTVDDLLPAVQVMGAVIAAGEAPPWLLYERDQLRSTAIDTLFQNLDEPDSTFGAVALEMVDRKVVEGEYDHCLFSLLGIASATYHLAEHKTTVGDQLVARLHDTRKRWANLDGDGRERMKEIAELATRRVAINRYAALENEFNQAVEVYNGAIDLAQNAYAGSPTYEQAMTRIRKSLSTFRQIRETASSWLLLIEHDGVRGNFKDLVTESQELERRCVKILN
jgi:hypothetical protein